MREELLISALLWWGFAEQELGDLSQRLATGWAVNAREKIKNVSDLFRRKMCQCRMRMNAFLFV